MPVITISGADGVGKTTTTTLLNKALKDRGVSVSFFHHREISKPPKSSHPTPNPTAAQPLKNRSLIHKLLSPVKPFLRYVGMDVVRQEYIYYKTLNTKVTTEKEKHAIVIVDRYLYDRYVQFQLQDNQHIMRFWILSLFGAFIQKPSTAILLRADPAKVHARKNELSESQIDNYQTLIKERVDRMRIVSKTIDTSELNAEQVVEAILSHLAEQKVLPNG